MEPTALTFEVDGTVCRAQHWSAGSSLEGAGAADRPVVVLAHGLAGTMDSGLAPFAEAFARAGLDALCFDYRGFGASGGEHRQVVSLDAQAADLRAAIALARTLPGADPDGVVLWGISLGGGHVLSAAAADPRIAAVVAAVPLVDGLAAARLALDHHAAADLLRSTGRGVVSALRRRTGGSPTYIPVVAPPGEVGALTVPGALEDYLSIAGPTWRNEVAADVVTELGTRRPAKAASDIACPVLVQIADLDTSAPPYAAAKAAFRGRAEVRHYPGDHFDLFPGKPWHDAAVAHAVSFLRRHLAVDAEVPVG